MPDAATPVRPARRRYLGATPEERRAHRRARLVGAALAVFGRRGFHAATVREICAEARLTERYFYESFTGMDALFAAVYAAVLDELRARTLAALQQAPAEPLAQAEAALRVFFEFVREDPPRARVALIDAMSVSPAVRALGSASHQEYAALARQFVEAAAAGRSAGVDAGLLAAGLIGLNVHVATSWVLDGCRLPVDAVVASALAVYRGLL